MSKLLPLIFFFLIKQGVFAQQDFLHLQNPYEHNLAVVGPSINEDIAHLNDFRAKMKLFAINSVSANKQNWIFNNNGLLVEYSRKEYGWYMDIDTITYKHLYSYDNQSRLVTENCQTIQHSDGISDTCFSSRKYSYNTNNRIDTIRFSISDDCDWVIVGDLEFGGDFYIAFEYDENNNMKNILAESLLPDEQEFFEIHVDSNSEANSIENIYHNSEPIDYKYEWKNIVIANQANFNYSWNLVVNNSKQQPLLKVESDKHVFNYIYDNCSNLLAIEEYSNDRFSGSLTGHKVWRCKYNLFSLPDTIFTETDTINYKYTFFPPIKTVDFEKSATSNKNIDFNYLFKTSSLNELYAQKSTRICGVDKSNICFVQCNTDSFYFHNDYLVLAINDGNWYFYNQDSLIFYQHRNKNKLPQNTEIVTFSETLQKKAFEEGKKLNPVFGVHLLWAGYEAENNPNYNIRDLLFPYSKLDSLQTIETSDSRFIVESYFFVSKCAAGDLISFPVKSNKITPIIASMLKNDSDGCFYFDDIIIRDGSTGKLYPSISVRMELYNQ